jgi:hypothetical protein
MADERKHMCLDIRLQHLARYKKSDNFLQWSVTYDETWVQHYKIKTKQKSVQWKHLSYPVAKKFKMKPSDSKLMLIILWG